MSVLIVDTFSLFGKLGKFDSSIECIEQDL